MRKPQILGAAGAGLLASAVLAAGIGFAGADAPSAATSAPTTTPIKHVVVLFQENISFDHYFGTYPHAVNAAGETPFHAAPGTPSVNGLTQNLLTNNPNAANPQRLAPTDVVPTIGCDNNHGYSPEQKAFDGGLMDRFVENTTGGAPCASSEVLDYFDGNTVTGYWNYAQHFAMSDNSYGTAFGPSTPGAIELVSGNTATAVNEAGQPLASQSGNVDNGTIYSNANPYASFDGCTAASNFYALGASAKSDAASNPSRNVGDLLNTHDVTWGWFQGGFTPTSRQPADATFPHGRPVCAAAHKNVSGASQVDYDAHHNPFAYYRSTANPEHLPPAAGETIGGPGQANHQYDTTDFDAAVAAGNLPSVSFVKAGHYQDGHAGYSDPLDEQRFIAQKVNEIEASPDWASTAIVIAYDDSDGWYDHQAPPIVRSSTSPEDFLSGTGQCGTTRTGGQVTQANDRCGFGPRLPLLVISPYAKQNFVDHEITDQTSVLRFIEDNWSLGRIGGGSLDAKANPITNMLDLDPSAPRAKAVRLDPDTGQVVGDASTPPATGPTGPAGANGTNGTNGVDGKNGAPGPQGPAGPQGTPGRTGAPGRTGKTGKAGSVGRITCTGRLRGRRVLVTCRTAHRASSRTAVRVRLLRGGHQVATGRAILRGRTATVTLGSRRALAHGRYALRVAVAQIGVGATGAKGAVRL